MADDAIEMMAKVIDPEAFGLPDLVDRAADVQGWSDRDVARQRALIIMRFLGELGSALD